MIVRVSTMKEFAMGHRLMGMDKCQRIHGHNWKLEVTVEGKAKSGILIEFGEFDKIVQTVLVGFDHYTLLAKRGSENFPIREGIKIVEFEPTCENLASHFADLLLHLLPKNIHSVTVRLWETSKHFAEVTKRRC